MPKKFQGKSFLWILPVILALLLSLNTFWSKPLVPGFDAPFYLTEIRSFSRSFPNPITYRNFDRYITIAIPGVISKIPGVNPVTSYRITATATYILISFSLFKLFKNITKKNSTAMVLSSAIVISPFLLNYTLLLANFAAFLILFTFFAVETSKNFKYKIVVLGIIFGLLFYIHNFSTVSFGLIIGFYYMFKLISNRDRKIVKEAATIFIIAGVIGFPIIARYLGIDLTFGHTVKTGLPGQPINAGNIKDIILSSIVVYTGKFWLIYFAIFTVVALIFFRKQILNHKKTFLIPTAIFIPSFILSFQPLFHISYLPERFATLACLSTYLFYITVITIPSLKKFIIPLAVMPLFLNYLSSDSLILNKGYRSFSNEEVGIYQEIKALMPKENSIVLMPSDHSYWAQYFLDGYIVSPGEHFVSCGDIKEQGWLTDVSFTLAKLLADKNTEEAKNHLTLLQKLLPKKTIYILSDTSLSCGNGKILNYLPEVKQLYSQNNWYLYELE